MLGQMQGIPIPGAQLLHQRIPASPPSVPPDPAAPPAHRNAAQPEKPHLQQRSQQLGKGCRRGELRSPLPSRTHLCPTVPAPRSCRSTPGSRAAPGPVPAHCTFPAAPQKDRNLH